MRNFYLFIVAMALIASSSFAQQGKNPKVSEVEAHLTQKAVNFVKKSVSRSSDFGEPYCHPIAPQSIRVKSDGTIRRTALL